VFPCALRRYSHKRWGAATLTGCNVAQASGSEEDKPIERSDIVKGYYVAPGEEVRKPYELFLKALAETRYSAIAKLSMHRREHVVLIRVAGGEMLLHTLYYPDELLTDNTHVAPAKISATRQELDLAVKLIHQQVRPFKPDQFHDTYRENVERLIEQKAKGKTITAAPKARRAPVIDLMEALRKTLKSSAAAAPAKTARTTKAHPARKRKAA
jgi:DNA end-binding protein Ku